MMMVMMKSNKLKQNPKSNIFLAPCIAMILSSDNWHVVFSIQLLALKVVEYMEFGPIWQIHHPHSRFKGR